MREIILTTEMLDAYFKKLLETSPSSPPIPAWQVWQCVICGYRFNSLEPYCAPRGVLRSTPDGGEEICGKCVRCGALDSYVEITRPLVPKPRK